MNFRIWVLIFLISSLLLFIGQFLAGRYGLMIMVIVSIVFNSYLYFFSANLILRLLKCKELDGQDSWQLSQHVEHLAQKARLPKPRVFIIQNNTPTSFSLGRNQFNAIIILSEGLLDKFNAEEIRAVVGHEVARIKNSYIFAFTSLAFLAYILNSFGHFGDKILPWNWRKSKPHLLMTLFFQNCLWFIVRLIIFPQNYHFNDQTASQLIESSKDLASTIWKLDSYAHTNPMSILPTTEFLYIVNPLTSERSNCHFNFHPELEDRIKKLVGYFPI